LTLETAFAVANVRMDTGFRPEITNNLGAFIEKRDRSKAPEGAKTSLSICHKNQPKQCPKKIASAVN
jgi:hypothetical protein